MIGFVKQKYLLFAAGMALLLICTLAEPFCTGCSTADRQEPGAQILIPRVGDPALDFSLENLGGKTSSMQDYYGQVVLLNFWNTRCRYCLQEMDLLENTHTSNERVTVVTVDVGEQKELLNRFMAEKGFTFPVLLDPNGELFRGYGLNAFPSTIIINEQGIISSSWIGLMDEATLQQLLETAFDPAS